MAPVKALPLVLLGLAGVSRADPHPMSGGATAAPAGEAQVAMTREKLTVAIGSKSAEVRAVVTLENRGPATRLKVGFPCDASEEAGAYGLPCSTRPLVTAGGRRVPLRQERGPRETRAWVFGKRATKGRHWVWPLAFAAGEKVELQVGYVAPLVNPNYPVPLLGMGLFYYVLRTGARWAGPIGELEMTVTLPFDALAWISPAGYTRAPGRITWRLKDHEPVDDLVLIGHLPTMHEQVQAGGDKEKMLALAARLKKEGGAAVFHDISGYLGIISDMANQPPPDVREVSKTALESAAILEGLAQ